MVDAFVVAYRTQRAWNTLVAWDLFLSGTGAGLFFLALLLGTLGAIPAPVTILGGWFALTLVAAAGLVLLVDLGVPGRFPRVLLRPRASWLSRGAWTMLLFGLFGAVALLPSLPGLGSLPWPPGSPAAAVLEALALALALALMLYTGLLLSSWNAIPSWNTPLLPMLFTTSSLLGATGALTILAVSMGTVSSLLVLLALALLVAVALQLVLYLVVMGSGPGAARESVRLLLSGSESTGFLIGVLLLGLLVPSVLLVTTLALDVARLEVLVAAGIVILLGTFVLRQSMLKTGVYRAG